MKKTAIDLVFEIDKSSAFISIEDWQKAKEIEKQQFIEAFKEGMLRELDYDHMDSIAEAYYNKTYQATEK